MKCLKKKQFRLLVLLSGIIFTTISCSNDDSDNSDISNNLITGSTNIGLIDDKRILEADPYPQVLDFMKLLKDNSINMTIISHKTTHPFRGKKYNLHNAARSWVDLFLKDKENLLLSKDNIFFDCLDNFCLFTFQKIF